MPFIEDWITHPMTIINRFQEKSPETFERDVRDYFEKQIADPNFYREIPSINDRLDNSPLPSGCLVRYRAMVQDMSDDEIYCTHFKVRSTDHRQIVMERSAKYTDLFICPPGFAVVDEEPTREKFSSRQCFSCVSIPNETQWVKEHFYRLYGEQMTMQKRPIETTDDVQQLLTPLKRLKTSEETQMTTTNAVEPAKTTNKTNFLVKVYDTTEEILLNTIVEFVGIFYDETVLKNRPDQSNDENDDESIPLGKTIHCVYYRKLSHVNPLLQHQPNFERDHLLMARENLLAVFEQIFPGDPLICQYLLLHLISRIYVRQSSSAYGKLSLNISHISTEQFAALEEILHLILPLYSRLSITIKTLNTMQLMPNKNVVKDDDPTRSQLIQTALQLPVNSHLLIDERQMECGQLTTLGLNNVKLLQDFLRQQTLKYEFHVYQLDYECDVRCLIVSSTKSILPSDVYIRYQTDENRSTIDLPTITKEQLDHIRRYLTFVGQQLNFDSAKNDPTSAINAHIQEDFVQMRKEKSLTNLDDFHLLLVLARLETLSRGETEMNESHWTQAKNLEFSRHQRMNQ